MVALKKYDILGKEIGEVEVDIEKAKKLANSQMIKDYLVALHANARQWSANTKGRKEVNVTGAKPHKQKGLGKARQGCFAAPQYKGGGVVFGPKPKFDMHVKVNKKERRAVIKSLLVQKIKENKAMVLKVEDKDISKTKQMSDFLNILKIKGTRVLIVGGVKTSGNLKRCLSNIQKTQFSDSQMLNGYNLALCKNLIFIDSVLEDVNTILKEGK